MIPSTAVDTSVIVAALASWHEAHHAAAEATGRLLEAGSLVLPSDVLLEAYSVLTRLPAPHRLSSDDAWRLLRENFARTRTVALGVGDTWNLLKILAAAGVTGGATYDARIVAAAVKGGATRILTLNARHFERLVPEGLEVVVPGRGRAVAG